MAKRMLIGSVLVILVLAFAISGFAKIDADALKHNTNCCMTDNNCGNCPSGPNCPTPCAEKSGDCTKMKDCDHSKKCSPKGQGSCESMTKKMKSSDCCAK